MHISEIPMGTSISIHVRTDDGEADLTTSVISPPVDSCRQPWYVLFADGIIKDGKIIQPNNIRQHYDAYWFDNKIQRLIKWVSVSFRLVTVNGHQFYVVVSHSDGIETNRRSAYRLVVSLPAVLQIGENHTTYEGHVHDLSVSGMGLTFTHEFTDNPVGKAVSVVFADEKKGDRFRLSGHCVRCDELAHNIYRVGCRLLRSDAGLAQYINRQQQLLLKEKKI